VCPGTQVLHDRLERGGLGVGFEQLEAVAVRIDDVTTTEARKVVVPLHGDIVLTQSTRDGGDVRDEDARVRLGSGAEVVLDADVQLEGSAAEPGTATRSEHGRLGHLGHAEHRPVELPQRVFRSARCGELHVVEPDELPELGRLVGRHWILLARVHEVPPRSA